MPGRNSPPMPLRSSTWWSSAFTSVPELWPAAGCTTIPAGLFTTSRSVSSYSTGTGMSSGCALVGTGAGSSTLILVAFLQGQVGLGLAAGDLDVPVVDQALCLRPRQAGNGSGQIAVQAFARVLGADGKGNAHSQIFAPFRRRPALADPP